MPHPLTEWLQEHFGDRLPGTGEVDQADVEEEMEELADGYEGVDPDE